MTEFRNLAIVDAHHAGLSDKEIGERYDITPAWVAKILRKAGIPPRQSGPPKMLPCPKKRKEYAKLCRVLGWQKAREAMGI